MVWPHWKQHFRTGFSCWIYPGKIESAKLSLFTRFSDSFPFSGGILLYLFKWIFPYLRKIHNKFKLNSSYFSQAENIPHPDKGPRAGPLGKTEINSLLLDWWEFGWGGGGLLVGDRNTQNKKSDGPIFIVYKLISHVILPKTDTKTSTSLWAGRANYHRALPHLC